MPSPFPGMDPYLEDPAYWSGFHTRFNVHLADVLTELLPKGYYADVEQHVWLQGADSDVDLTPFAYPDVYIGERNGRAGGSILTATRPTAETRFPLPAKKKGAKFVKIVDGSRNRVVTAIELLSPSNKTRGEGLEDYLAKRNEYVASGTNLVELDLLREGERLPVGRPKLPNADYYSFCSRADMFPTMQLWAWTIRDPLPFLPIPLKPAHGSIVLSLKVCLDRTYDAAGYRSRIGYTEPPACPMRSSDAEWAASFLPKPAKKKKK